MQTKHMHSHDSWPDLVKTTKVASTLLFGAPAVREKNGGTVIGQGLSGRLFPLAVLVAGLGMLLFGFFVARAESENSIPSFWTIFVFLLGSLFTYGGISYLFRINQIHLRSWDKNLVIKYGYVWAPKEAILSCDGIKIELIQNTGRNLNSSYETGSVTVILRKYNRGDSLFKLATSSKKHRLVPLLDELISR